MICDLCNLTIYHDTQEVIKIRDKYLHRDCIEPRGSKEKQLNRIEDMLIKLLKKSGH